MKDKPFYTSRTFWVNILAIVASLTGVFGLDLSLDPETQTAIVGAIMGLVNIYLRLTTDTPIQPLRKK